MIPLSLSPLGREMTIKALEGKTGSKELYRVFGVFFRSKGGCSLGNKRKRNSENQKYTNSH